MSETLTETVSHEALIKRSRFIAHAGPCRNEDEALAFLEQHRDDSASHNCWAWKAGQQYRFDDDGEPGGTAGKPILQSIEGRGLDQIVVLVVRHFGGIKLGTGGLIRAYGGTAAEALREAATTPLVKRVRLRATVPFECVDSAHQALASFEAEKLDETWLDNGLELILSLPETSREAFGNALRDLSRGEGRIRRI